MSKEFDAWIEKVEAGEVRGRGLLTASLDYRSALRIAFSAGQMDGMNQMIDASRSEILEKI